MLIPLDHIQVVYDPLRIAVPQENFSVVHFHANAAVPPDIGSLIAYTANSISSSQAPFADLVLLDLNERNGFQPEAQRADFNSMAREVVVKTIPGHAEHGDKNHPEKAGRQPRTGIRNRQNCRADGHQWNQKEQAPGLARMDFFRDDVSFRHRGSRHRMATPIPERKSQQRYDANRMHDL